MGHGTHCHTHYEAFHLCASKGQTDALNQILLYASTRLGTPALIDILNARSKSGYGTVDLALKANMATARMLRQYGAVEQAEPPDKWKRGARRDPEYAKQQRDAQRVPGFVDNEVRFWYSLWTPPSPSFWIQNLRMVAQRPSAGAPSRSAASPRAFIYIYSYNICICIYVKTYMYIHLF